MKPATDPNKSAIHAFITNEAHDTWHTVAAEEGASVTALLQALGDSDLAAVIASVKVTNGHGHQVPLVKAARNIDAQRRQRAR